MYIKMNKSLQIIKNAKNKILYPKQINNTFHRPKLNKITNNNTYPYDLPITTKNNNSISKSDEITVYLVSGLFMSCLISNCILCLDHEIDPNDYTSVILASVI